MPPFYNVLMRFPLSPQTVLITALMGGMAGYIAFGETTTVPVAPRVPTTRPDLHVDEREACDIFKNTSPSVAFITTLQQQVDIFGRDLGERPSGTGSGFVWDNQGHIVTNFHVIQNSTAHPRVSFATGEEYQASIVGIAPEHDLAVLKIEPKRDLTPLPIGTSHDLLVGQRAYAIGNPFGLDHSLTSGIVSALNRTIYSPAQRPIEDVIQTDAAINPGNSGGPLLDSYGRVIGITTAINSPSGANAGIGFAVPIDTINRVVPQLIMHGKVEKATIGIAQRDEFTKPITARLKVVGVPILAVYPGTAAEAAGLKPAMRVQDGIRVGDILQKIGDYPTRNSDELYLALQKFNPGDTVTLTYWREGKIETKRIVLDSSLNQTK